MKNKSKNLLLRAVTPLIFLLFIFMFTGSVFDINDDIYDRINRNIDVFGKIYKEISLNYVDNINSDRFIKAGIEGMLSTLDPYTTYIDPENRDEVELITSGKYGGLGVTIGIRDSIIVITDIMNGYEAQRKGLRIGDKIRNINGVQIIKSIEKTRQMIRGVPGTTLNMQVERNNEIIDFNLTRQEIIFKNVSYSDIIGEQENGILYLKLDRFTSSAPNEVENILKNYKSKGNPRGVIIDIRNNSGGLLESAIGILNKFVERNSLILITKGRQKESERKHFSSENPVLPKDIPLAVIVNKSSASASEIVAGAIQDLDRGVIIGTKTFGKGLVQQIKDIGNDTKLKITISRYFTPSGRWIQEKNYFKENKYGIFENTETYLQAEFKTMNGRIVYANGGIAPDIEINPEPQTDIATVLVNRDMFFKFANYYLEKNSAIKSFVCTDETYEQFIEFLSGTDFRTETDKKIIELQDIAEKKSYSSGFKEHLEKLRKEETENTRLQLQEAREEIKELIEQEINRRVNSEYEQIKASLLKDIHVQKAIEILKNKNEYNKILNK